MNQVPPHHHHHLHNPAEFVDGHNEAKLVMLGLTAAALAGPIGWIAAGGAGAAAGIAWLRSRARERSLDTSHLSNLLAVEPDADGLTDDQLHGLGHFLSEHPWLSELSAEQADNFPFPRDWIVQAPSDD
jgi:hypothetical protein